jgi:hypothetical protein
MRHIQSWEVCCLVWENISAHRENLGQLRGKRTRHMPNLEMAAKRHRTGHQRVTEVQSVHKPRR